MKITSSCSDWQQEPAFCMIRKTELKMIDKGGTRSGTDRRKFQYTAYIPERRLGRDRRKGFDRRGSIARRKESERRFSLKHQGTYPIERRNIFRKQA